MLFICHIQNVNNEISFMKSQVPSFFVFLKQINYIVNKRRFLYIVLQVDRSVPVPYMLQAYYGIPPPNLLILAGLGYFYMLWVKLV